MQVFIFAFNLSYQFEYLKAGKCFWESKVRLIVECLKILLEGITGIYEQLTPLQFYFIEKPAQILQIPSLNLKLQILIVLNSRNLCKQMKIVATYFGQSIQKVPLFRWPFRFYVTSILVILITKPC